MRARAPIAGNPVLIGAATVLVVLVAVFLSYNANQGCRSSRPTSSRPRRRAPPTSCAATRCGSAARASARSTRSTVERQDDGTSVAVLGLKLERAVEPLPKDSTLIIRPRSALGLKYVELTRGTSDEGFDDGDTIPLAPGHARAGRVRRVPEHVRRATRAAAQENLRGLRRRARRPRPEHQPGDRRLPAAAARHPAGRAEPVEPRDEPPRFFGELGDAARIVAPAAEAQAELFVNLDTHVRRAARGRAAVHPGVDHRGPPDARRGDPRASRSSARSCANTEGLFRELQPGVRALRTAAPDLADALEIGTPVLRRRRRSTGGSRRCSTSCRRSPRTRWSRAASRLTDTLEDAQPDAAVPRAGQTPATTSRSGSATSRSLLSEGDVNGTWQRFIIVATPQGPNNEGGPSSAPANGADAREPPAHQPVPEHGGAGPAAGVRGRQRAVPRAAAR